VRAVMCPLILFLSIFISLSLSLSLSLGSSAARYHPGSGDEYENEGPRNNESPGYPTLGPPCEPKISCSGAHRVRLVSAISTGEKMIAIAGRGGGGGSYHERR